MNKENDKKKTTSIKVTFWKKVSRMVLNLHKGQSYWDKRHTNVQGPFIRIVRQR